MSINNKNDMKDILNKYIKYLSENNVQYPVSGLDYSSLYPSLIMAYNLSPEYLIVDEKYKDTIQNKGYNIHNINFEYKYKNYLDEENCKNIRAWTVRHNESNIENPMFGLYPTILRDLFKQRAEMKKELAIYKDKKEHMEKYDIDYINKKEYKECIFKLKYCDTKQKALKVFMNTFYGEMGNKNSPLFQLPLAGGVTSSGQYNLLLIKKYVESLNHKVYYGDSVVGDTPIIVRINRKYIKIMKIEDLGWKNSYILKYNDKEYIFCQPDLLHSYEILTEDGWTTIKKMIRHKTNKRIYRITTKISTVDVTEDHSLLNENKEKITPDDCNTNTKLLHWDYINILNNSDFNLHNINLDIDYDISYYLKQEYIYTYTKLKAQNLYLYFKLNGYNSIITVITKNSPIYRLHIINEYLNEIKDATQIQKIEYIGNTDRYVYDLETKNHHFAAGIGQMVVHNTDSLYISCPSSYYKETDKKYYTEQISKEEYNTKLVTITFKAIEDIKVKVNKYLYEDNGTKYLKMSYEEVLYPLAFLSKKKYFGIPHETLPNFKPKDLFIRGLEVKKRGVSELLKIICLDLMWKAMDLNNTKTLKELVIDKIKEIFTKKWNLEDFIQTGVWKPEKKNITLNNFAQRMREENKLIPTPGERFSYVIIKRYPYKYDYKGRQIELSKADKMEYLDTVEKYNYNIDLKYYFDKQLVGQFARLISYDQEYEVLIFNDETNQYDIDDDKTINNCKKYILKLVDQFNNTYIDRKHIFKDLYKAVNDKYKDKKYKVYNRKYDILFNSKCKIDDKCNIYDIIQNNITHYINKYCNINIEYKDLIKKIKKNNKEYLKIYNKKNESYYIQQQCLLQEKFNKELNNLLNILNQHNLEDKLFNIDNLNLINIITYVRNKKKLDDICNNQSDSISDLASIVDNEEIIENLDNDDLYIKINNDILNKIYNTYINLINIKKIKMIHENIFNSLYKNLFSNDSYIEKPKDLIRF